MEKKMTQKEMFTAIRDYLNGVDVTADKATVDEMVEFIDARVAQLEKKANKPTKVSDEDLALMDATMTYLTENPGATIAQMTKALEVKNSQKMTAIMKRLEGKVTVDVEKNTRHFTVA